MWDGRRAGGLAWVTVRSGNVPRFVTRGGKVNYSMNKRVHLGRPAPPTTRRRDARASEGQDRPMMAGRSQLERHEGVVIRPIKRSIVGEAFWISADLGMGGFGRGCDRLWMGGQGGLVAHLVLALELWPARWLAGSLAGLENRTDVLVWPAGREGGKEKGRT